MKIFHLPDLGEGLAEAEIREWYVKAGDTVTVDQPLASMETAKAVVDVPSPYAGKITKLHGAVNDIIKTGAPLITFEIEAAAADKKAGSVVGSLEEGPNIWDEGEVVVGSPKTKTEAVKAMPAARTMAQQMQIDLATIKGTGPRGLVTVADVKHAAEQSSVALSDGMEKLHGVRRMMAVSMAASVREMVPVTIIEDADITNLPAEVDISVLLLKAIAHAATVEPALNAWFDGKRVERKLFQEVNVGLAVDSPEGLFVPVIKAITKQTDAALREAINHAKEAVRHRSLSPSEMQGATITLSNFGTIAGRYATPIIVPPMVAILGCGRSRDVPIVREGKIVVGRMMPFSLTFDHRAVTGGEATRFLNAVIQFLRM